MIKHVMLDLETLGKTSNAVMLSIGAAHFNLYTGEIYSTFERQIHPQSSIDAGCEVDGDTIYWWMNQDREAQKQMQKDPTSLGQALYEFRQWFDKIGSEDTYIWCTAPDFDMPILRNAYLKLRQQPPFKYNCVRDVRTMRSLARDTYEYYRDHPERSGIEHTSLADCLFQIDYLCDIATQLKQQNFEIS